MYASEMRQLTQDSVVIPKNVLNKIKSEAKKGKTSLKFNISKFERKELFKLMDILSLKGYECETTNYEVNVVPYKPTTLNIKW